MEIREKLKMIEEEIQGQVPDFRPEYAIEALENTNVYLFRYFPKLKMIVLTERLCRDFQVQPVYQNMPISFSKDFVTEQDQEKFEKMYYDIDAGTPSASANFRGKNQMAWCHVTLTTVEWDEDHNPELCTGIVENRTKEEIIKEELSSILSSISCGILQYRKSDNKLLRANKAALDILGYSSVKELTNDREYGVVRNVLAEDRKYIAETVNDLKYPGDIRTVEYRVKRKDSTQIRYCYGTVQIYNDIHGEQIVLRSVMDITDRKIKEDVQGTNKDLMQRLNTVMSGISGGFGITLDDSGFTYLYLSEEIAALQGYTIDELLKSCNGNALDNVYPEDRDYVSESLKNITEESSAFTLKYRLPHKDGGVVWISETGKKVIDKDGNSVFYRLIQDITDSQKRAEELSHLLTMQNQMVTSLSCGVLAYTVPQHELLIVNKETKRIFQHKSDNPKSVLDAILDHVLPEDLPVMREATKKLKKWEIPAHTNCIFCSRTADTSPWNAVQNCVPLKTVSSLFSASFQISPVWKRERTN